MRRFAFMLVLCAASAGLASSSAGAATTMRIHEYTSCPPKGSDCRLVRELEARAGEERNAVRVHVGAGALTISDEAHPVEATAGCEQVDERTARCPGRFDTALVSAGAGDDRIFVMQEAATAPALAAGAAGDDDLRLDAASARGRLEGGEGDDLVVGGPGGDTLGGGEGTDRVSGGDGGDYVEAGDVTGPAGPDNLDGGPGQDRVAYLERTAGVDVDLQRVTPQGQPGEGDVLTSVEEVRGGRGDDVLRGDQGPNFLEGNTGHDVVDGRAGDDELLGDRIDGGSGADELTSETGGDLLSCGTGTDRVLSAGGGLVTIDCEHVVHVYRAGSRFELRPPRLARATPVVTFFTQCDHETDRGCPAVVTLRAAGLVVGRTRTRLPRENRRGRIAVRLNRRGRRLLRAGGPLRVAVTAVVPSEEGTQRSRFAVLLQSP